MGTARAFAIVLSLAIASVSAVARERYVGEFTLTAYCSCRKCCGANAQGITASGKRVRQGMIAADWNVLPQGTKVSLSCFPGREFVVEDKGGAIRGNRIDVWFPSHHLALEFGVDRDVKVWIVEDRPRRQVEN